MIKKCLNCKEDFQTSPSIIKRGGGKYCSIKCKYEFWSQSGHPLTGKVGHKHSNEARQKIGLASKGRKKTFLAKKKISASQQGISLDSWSGFITPEDRLERIRFRNEVQKLVLERDDYTCQICGQRGGQLQVDHIQSWAEYIDLRFDIKNCRTVCMACHYKLTFGRELPKDVTAWGHNLSQIGG